MRIVKLVMSRTMQNTHTYIITVLCKSNPNVFRQNSRLFLVSQRKSIEFSMEATFQQKVVIICDAYCFQGRKFLNNILLGTK